MANKYRAALQGVLAVYASKMSALSAGLWLGCHNGFMRGGVGFFGEIFLVNVAELSGMNVIEAGGKIIGEVVGAEVNTASWQITKLQIKLSSTASETLGFKKRFRSSTVCMPVTLVSAVGDVITINTDLNTLSQDSQITECT